MRNLTAISRAAFLGTAFLAASSLNAERMPPNTVTFENQSGQDALVKLVGPTRGVVPVANGSRAGIHVDAGVYYILVRYGAVGH
jgi:hypothetical protein